MEEFTSQQNLISFNLLEEKKKAIFDALKTLETELFPLLKSISSEDRKSLSKMGDKTFNFVQKSLDYVKSNPEFVPQFLDLAEFKKDMESFIELRNIFNSLFQLTRLVEDTEMLAGSDSLAGALVYYASVKSAAKIDVPRAKEIYEDLFSRYSVKPSKIEANK